VKVARDNVIELHKHWWMTRTIPRRREQARQWSVMNFGSLMALGAAIPRESECQSPSALDENLRLRDLNLCNIFSSDASTPPGPEGAAALQRYPR
jgi:hypothetical protein